MATQQTPTEQDVAIFKQFLSYPFHSDEKFQAGLKTLSSDADVGKAKWFYFSKFVKPFDYSLFLAWKASQPSEPTQTTPQPSSSDSTPPPAADTATSTSSEPPYPRSFHELCEMVARGEPIPGIRKIPDKLSEEKPSTSVMAPRKKPWEKNKGDTAVESSAEGGITGNGYENTNAFEAAPLQ
ncbi:hypothetical protein HK104_001255 [Borealophlyctis nickersoniae]|nr:hypothetical protein HK104_001255 [Borealophlyctis nickersoniae]